MAQTNFIPEFELTSRLACKASIILEGLTGSGKSGAALMLAYGLVGGFKDANPHPELWKKIFAVDTENKSLNLFIDLPTSWGGKFDKFYSFQLGKEIGYRPTNYLKLRDVAIKNKGEVFIGDSITHMWTAEGGVLDMVTKLQQENPRANQYAVWGNDNVVAEKQAIVETIRHKDIHCITTVRVKEKFGMEYDAEKQKNNVVSLGEQQLQQEGLKYEADLVLHMIEAGSIAGQPPIVEVIKSRYAPFTKGERYKLTPELCEHLRKYLEEGTDPEEIFEAQRIEYITALKTYLDENTTARTIFKTLKTDAGHKDTKLQDLPLEAVRKLYSQIII